MDRFTPGGQWVRALHRGDDPVVVRAAQSAPDQLAVEIDAPQALRAPALATVVRMLGVERDVAPFHSAANAIPWLAPLADRMLGLKPPRYPTLWEASVNAIVFQQVSLHAAMSVVRRLLLALGTLVADATGPLYAFPTAERFLAADKARVGTLGLSAAKLATLRRVAEALVSGELREEELERLPSRDAAAELQRIKGIGPWTAAVMLLRGMGRLDVFPGNDSGVAANLRLLTGQNSYDAAHLLEELGSQKGMLYFTLLLGRLEGRGALGTPSTPVDAAE